MSRKQKERKEQKLEQAKAEQQEIVERRNERLSPTYATLRQLVIIIILTIIILTVGVVVNSHLGEIGLKLHKL